jgi:hypothetical protein
MFGMANNLLFCWLLLEEWGKSLMTEHDLSKNWT